MLTEKDYCDYKLVLELKELGYDYIRREGLIHLYDAQKWLREENGIIVYPQYLTNGQTWMCLVYEEKKMLMHSIGRGSYNEVLNAGIKEAVKILKEK